MKEQDQIKIARDNRAEVQRAKTGLSTRDWGIVLSAVVIAVLVLGFIYASSNPGPESRVEPAAGSAAAPDQNTYTAPIDQGTAYDNQETNSNSPDSPQNTPSSTTPEITPNPAD